VKFSYISSIQCNGELLYKHTILFWGEKYWDFARYPHCKKLKCVRISLQILPNSPWKYDDANLQNYVRKMGWIWESVLFLQEGETSLKIEMLWNARYRSTFSRITYYLNIIWFNRWPHIAIDWTDYGILDQTCKPNIGGYVSPIPHSNSTGI